MRKNYTVSNDFDIAKLADAIRNFFESQKGMVSQAFAQGSAEWAVQAKDGSMVKKVIGMDKALTVKLSHTDTDLNVETGQGEWMTHVTARTIGWFVFWPFFITGTIGSVQQKQLHKEIDLFISDYVQRNNNISQNSCKKFCSNCGASLTDNGLFCSSCGTKIV